MVVVTRQRELQDVADHALVQGHGILGCLELLDRSHTSSQYFDDLDDDGECVLPPLREVICWYEIRRRLQISLLQDW